MKHARHPIPDQRPRTARELGIMQGFPPPPEKCPTLENWDLPPFNRWSFQNVRNLIPSVDVRRGDTVQTLKSDIQDVGGITYVTPSGKKKTVAQCLIDTYTDGFLVFHKGRIVSEQYFNDMTEASTHLAQSVSKSVTGALAGILHGDGVLDMEEPLGDIVPELGECGYADASLAHVMDMQSGVRFIEDYGEPYSDMTRIDVASGWRPVKRGDTRATIRDVILSLPKVREHGEVFDYRSIETDVLAWAMERMSGKRLADLLSERIWSRIGAERDAYFTVDTAGTALADGGFNATLRDFTRFGLLMLNGGRVDGEQIVPAKWVDSLSHGETSKFGSPYTDLSPNGAYRRKWWVHDVAKGDFMARGVFGQLIYVDRAHDFMAVKLSTWPDFLVPAFSADELRALAAIRRAFSS